MKKFIPQETLQEIISQVDPIQFIRKYAALNGKGWGLCPLHQEKHPSFHVDREKKLWHCFGCGRGGNLFQFVMQKLGVPFLVAVEILAHEAGISLDSSKVDWEKVRRKQRILEEINRWIKP